MEKKINSTNINKSVDQFNGDVVLILKGLVLKLFWHLYSLDKNIRIDETIVSIYISIQNLMLI